MSLASIPPHILAVGGASDFAYLAVNLTRASESDRPAAWLRAASEDAERLRARLALITNHIAQLTAEEASRGAANGPEAA